MIGLGLWRYSAYVSLPHRSVNCLAVTATRLHSIYSYEYLLTRHRARVLYAGRPIDHISLFYTVCSASSEFFSSAILLYEYTESTLHEIIKLKCVSVCSPQDGALTRGIYGTRLV